MDNKYLSKFNKLFFHGRFNFPKNIGHLDPTETWRLGFRLLKIILLGIISILVGNKFANQILQFCSKKINFFKF